MKKRKFKLLVSEELFHPSLREELPNCVFGIDDEYELIKDISLPNKYYRAGAIKLKSEWEALFPGCFDFFSREWFIHLSTISKQPNNILSLEETIVNTVFHSLNLHSISYKQAAVRALVEYKNTVLKCSV